MACCSAFNIKNLQTFMNKCIAWMQTANMVPFFMWREILDVCIWASLCINTSCACVYDKKLHGFFWITVQPFPCLHVFNGVGCRQFYLLYNIKAGVLIVIEWCERKVLYSFKVTWNIGCLCQHSDRTVLRLHMHMFIECIGMCAIFLFVGNEVKGKS